MNSTHRILLIICLILWSANSFAQAPQAIPYQAVARDNSGNPISNQNISLQFTVHNGSAAGTVVYRETHPATTNALGLFTVNIGQGSASLGTFPSIDWGGGSKFIQVEMDVNNGNPPSYTDMGTTQMLSVPYALFAGSTGSGGGGTLDNAYDFGGPGVGRTINADAGAVQINGVDGFVSTGTFNSGAALTTAGAGARMIWYPKKAAFRAPRSCHSFSAPIRSRTATLTSSARSPATIRKR